MNREQLMTVTVALACFAALGASATTLASSLSSDPDEAVDLDYDLLPIESDEAADLQRQIESNTDQQSEASGQGSASSQTGGSGASESSSTAGDGVTGGGDGQSSGLSDAEEGGLALTNEPVSSLLSTLFPLAVVAALLAVLARYRDRIRAMLAPDDGRQPGEESAREGFVTPPRDANDVFATWDALVRNLDVDADARTTRECASAAAEAGMDADAVQTLRRTFEEVRYGDRPVTEQRSRRVREVRDRLDLGREGTDGEVGPR